MLAMYSSGFLAEARSMLPNLNIDSSHRTFERRFRSLFGVPLWSCEPLWALVIPHCPSSGRKKHLLWALMFLKGYHTIEVNAAVARVDEKTYRKWSWIFVHALASVSLIVWSKRSQGRENAIYKASVDGVDVRICEPSPFNAKWYSHKFKGPGLRYEVGVAIGTGHIVWVNGPFPCGSWPDVKIFRTDMRQRLDRFERVVADGGYQDTVCSWMDNAIERSTWKFVRARHEAVNKRLKHFKVLSNTFRHSLSLHSDFFFAVANVTQFLIERGEVVFHVFR